MTEPPTPSAGPPGASRPARRIDDRLKGLERAIGKLKIRRLSVPLDRWLMIAGGFLMAAGIAVILLGWYGAAHTPYGFEQVPYLISGGVLGLALTIVGGLFYFAYWLTRQLQESRRQADASREALTRIAELLVARNGSGRANGGAVRRTAATSPGPEGAFVATPAGTMFHRPDCAVVLGREGLRAVRGDEDGLEPCRLCDPLGTEATTTALPTEH